MKYNEYARTSIIYRYLRENVLRAQYIHIPSFCLCHSLPASFARVLMRDFPGGPVVKTMLPLQGGRVQSLVMELRSHKPQGKATLPPKKGKIRPPNESPLQKSSKARPHPMKYVVTGSTSADSSFSNAPTRNN